MVIELSGVKFGLKSYLWFQNQTSAQQEFDLKSQVWFQTKIARHEVQLPLDYSHFEITEFSQYGYCILLIKKPVCEKAETKRLLHLILYSKQKWCDMEQKWCDLKQKWCDLEHDWRDLEQMRFRAKSGAI